MLAVREYVAEDVREGPRWVVCRPLRKGGQAALTAVVPNVEVQAVRGHPRASVGVLLSPRRLDEPQTGVPRAGGVEQVDQGQVEGGKGKQGKGARQQGLQGKGQGRAGLHGVGSKGRGAMGRQGKGQGKGSGLWYMGSPVFPGTGLGWWGGVVPPAVRPIVPPFPPPPYLAMGMM